MRLRCSLYVIAILLTFFTGFAIAGPIQDANKDDASQLVQTRGQIFTTRTNPKALPLPKKEGVFHFAIYGDRTGGDPSGLKFLRKAVADTNLMDPDFVMTVGDLIQGYNRPQEWMQQMEEFQGIMSDLKMSWFPVAGNHDVYWDFRDRNRPNIHHEANFEKHFGPLWYAFQHKDCGFVVLYSDEGNYETGEKGFQNAELQNVSPKQMAFLDEALDKLKPCKQVFVFLHHPRWLGGNYQGSNWPTVHKKLVAAGNVKGVFAGHIHHMTFQGPVDGIEYYTLATTGGHLSLESNELGYLHHFNVVTVRDQGFTVATLPVGSVIDPKTFKPDFLDDVNTVRTMRPTRAGQKLALDLTGRGKGEYQVDLFNPGNAPIEVTISPTPSTQWRALPDHQHVVIPPGKTADMTFYYFRETESRDGNASNGNGDIGWDGFEMPTMAMNVDYLHKSARIRLPQVSVPLELGLGMPDDLFTNDLRKCLALRGVRGSRRRSADSVRIASSDLQLPQGPFTIEAWVHPTNLSNSRAIVAKTQSSEYALFLHDGRAQFDIHVDGRYVSPATDDQIAINQWTHVAGVYDGQQASLYVNGKKIKSLPAPGKRTQNQLPLFVGADPDGVGNPTRPFAGRIDEVRLSRGIRYRNNFEPSPRHTTDPDTLLLLHFDQTFGPFLPNDAAHLLTIFKTGLAEIVPKDK